ncbi:MAG TPA: ABC transporter substrate-binding protein [Candidatus Tectomicrobia bacterium]|nr:ABC transporter substrate-binding protein [Candidatus Tectomicrobia bacterium]
MSSTSQPSSLILPLHRFIVVITVLVFLLATGASMALAQSTAAGEKPKPGGIVRMAEREPPNLDPHLSISFLTHNAASLAYSGLVRLTYANEQKSTDDLTIMPDLAERWEYLDPKTVVFYLRKGVKFHNKPPVNGREMKAHDVKYSLERFAAKSGFRSRFDDVERIEAVDDYTVKIITKHPFAPMLINLATPAYNVILPKEAEEQYGDFNKVEAVIGTGPFMLESYERGVRMIFKKNPDFYVKGLPYLDGVEWQMTPDAAARLSLLRAGKVDFLHVHGFLLGEEAIPLQRTNPELKVTKFRPLGQGLFYMRTDQPPFNDVRVRRALSLAINRPAWLEALHFGEGCIDNGPVPCALEDWRLDAKELDPAKAKYLVGFDREEAKRLLAEAGHPKGFTTPMNVYPGYVPPWPSNYELAVDELSKVGIKVELKPQEYGDYISTTYLGKFDKLAMGPITPFLEVDDWLYGVFYPGQPNNRSHVDDATLNEMLVAQRREIDPEKRQRIVHDIQRYLVDKAYYVYVPIGLNYYTHQQHFKGSAPKIGFTLAHRLIAAWLEK